jgi:hypothetical protein
MQAVVEGHDTASSSPPYGMKGADVVSTDHLVPSHRSANVSSLVLVKTTPTAVHALVNVQDTPLKTVFGDGITLGALDQRVPFQRSKNAPL